METPSVIQKKSIISPIWILPVIALAISGWLLFTSHQNSGIDITIYFSDASGITPGKTQVIHRGIPVGQVRKVKPHLDSDKIAVLVKMDRVAQDFLVEDSLFWVVHPTLSAARISGLDTIISGNYIGIRKGGANKPSRVFEGLASTPTIAKDAPGLYLSLIADTLSSIQEDTGVYHKNILIGSVGKYSLSEDDTIHIDLHIKPDYMHLVKKTSRFYNAGGLTITGNVTGVKLQLESLASLLKGGIVLFTPDSLKDSPPAENGHVFNLYKDFDAADYGVPMSLELASGAGIVEGVTSVTYRGLKAGVVKKININNNKRRTVTAYILLDPRAKIILKKNTRFWIVRPEISFQGINNLDTLLKGAYITFSPGDGAYHDHFKVLPQTPPQLPARPGSAFTLISDNAGGVSSGTPVLFRKVKVGEVSDVGLNHDGSKVLIDIYIYKPYIDHLSRRSVFWKIGGIQFDASLAGVKIDVAPMQNMITGGISFLTPEKVSGPDKTESTRTGDTFTLYNNYRQAVESVPAMQPKGKRVQLRTEHLGSVAVDSPILYKKLAVGKVTGLEITDNRQEVIIDCLIDEQFTGLINSNSIFYNLSGIDISASLSGVRIQTGSFLSIINGGIGLLVTAPNGEKVETNKVFTLFDTLTNALSPNGRHIRLLANHLHSIGVDSPLLFKKVVIGTVTGFELTDNRQKVFIDCIIKDQYADLLTTETRFYNLGGLEISGGLSGIKLKTGTIQSMISGGIGVILPSDRDSLPSDKLVYQLFSDKDTALSLDQIMITIHFDHIEDLNAGAKVKYKNIEIGEVKKVYFSNDYNKVSVDALINKEDETLFRSSTLVWLENADISLSGIKNPKSLFFGSYINISPGSGTLSREFYGSKALPPHYLTQDGSLNLILESNHRGSLVPGAPVFYRQVKIGRVTHFQLSDTFQKVLIGINIDKAFTTIIGEKTRFWRVSGIKAEGGLFSGVKISTGTLQALISGGIALATPEENKSSQKTVFDNFQFTLHDTPRDEWLDWAPEILTIKGEVQSEKTISQ